MWPSFIRSVLVLAHLTNASSSAASASNTTSIVDLGYARYRATLDPTANITNFLGIKYAAPPTGNLRWRAPQSPEHTPNIINADTQPKWCYQTAAPWGQSPTSPFLSNTSTSNQDKVASSADSNSSEDCLFLNVHVPGSVSSHPKSSYPVVVWIHGGGYTTGYASMFDGSKLVLNGDHKVISVVIQYRLGVFGFLAGSKVKAGGALNAGLLDQQFALKWVQSHISSFGGDPNRVTIWGQSAGGGSVVQHIIANNGRTNPPLFKNAITSSAYLPSQYKHDDAIPEAVYSQVVSYTNCSQASDTLKCLRSADISGLSDVNAAIQAAGFFGTITTLPVVDGELITQRPSSAFASGKVNGNLLLSVANTAEGVVFVNTTITGAPATTQFVREVFPNLTQSQADQVATAYAPLGGSLEQFQAIQAEATFVCPTYMLQPAFSGKSWKGQLAVPPAIHGLDLPYYFTGFTWPGFDFPPAVDNPSLVASFAKSFLSFVASENPNTHIESSDVTPFWPKYSTRNRTEVIFNVKASDIKENDIQVLSTDPALVSRCNLWHSLSSSTSQ